MGKVTNKLDELMNKDPQKSAKSFWEFYAIFFLIVFLILLVGRKNYSNVEYEYGSDELEMKLKFSSNYLFDYKVTLDNQIFDYYGKKDQEIELFKYNNNDYYHNELFYIKKDSWKETDNPYKFYEFLNNENYRLIMNNAYFDNKTDNNNIEWTYKISSNTLNSILYNKETDFDEMPNTIIVVTDEDGLVKGINYNLDSYCKNNSLCDKSLKIELSFDMINEIKEIDNPIE